MKDARDSSGGESGLSRRELMRRGGLAIAAVGAAPILARGASAETAPSAPGATDVPRVPTPGATTLVLRARRTMQNPDGRLDVPAMTYNDTLPGPEIRVREGDTVRFQLENLLGDQDTLTHWHGLLLPASMDGVPRVSSAPVPPKRVLVYEYPIRQSGTYWYHSHQGLQEQLGLYGAFVIEPKHEPGGYDVDAVLLFSDWTHQDPDGIVPNLRKEGVARAGKAKGGMSGGGMSGKDGMAKAAGMGAPDLSDVKYDAFLLNGTGTQAPFTLAVKPGQRVRLRLVNGAASTYFFVQMDGHPLRITHADGQPVRPVEVDRVLLGMGETYDAVVEIREAGAFTIHGLAQDGSGQAVGVLHTPGSPATPNLSMPAPGPRTLAYSELRAPEDTTLPEGEVRSFRLVLGGDMSAYTWSINGALYPDADPLLIRQGERVQVEIVNQTMMYHPMHLHGHFFRLLSGSGGDRFAPRKHTVNLAPGGTERVEFTADNPGSWIFHCHNLYHFEAGMARVWTYEV